MEGSAVTEVVHSECHRPPPELDGLVGYRFAGLPRGVHLVRARSWGDRFRILDRFLVVRVTRSGGRDLTVHGAGGTRLEDDHVDPRSRAGG